MNVPYYLVVKFTTWLFLRLGFGLTVRGGAHVPRSGAFVVASNHLSYLDPVVVGVACPRLLSFMARADLYRHPLMRWFLRNMGAIPLHREAGDLAAIREAVRRLRRGQPVAIFPEGERQIFGELGEAKRGVGLVAALGRVPIIPMLVQGTFQALPRGSRWLRRAKIRVAFGPQITYTDERFSVGQPGEKTASAAHHEALAEAVTQSWRQLQDELEHR